MMGAPMTERLSGSAGVFLALGALGAMGAMGVLGGLAGCDASPRQAATSPSRESSTTTVPSRTQTPPLCHPASRVRTTRASGPEIQGTGHGATLYGLMMARRPPPIRAGDTVKIVWRMTGRGPLKLTATDPSGRLVPLTFGPEPHATSNYSRPGSEWGSGYRFDTAGCWRLDAKRTFGSAEALVEVLPHR